MESVQGILIPPLALQSRGRRKLSKSQDNYLGVCRKDILAVFFPESPVILSSCFLSNSFRLLYLQRKLVLSLHIDAFERLDL